MSVFKRESKVDWAKKYQGYLAGDKSPEKQRRALARLLLDYYMGFEGGKSHYKDLMQTVIKEQGDSDDTVSLLRNLVNKLPMLGRTMTKNSGLWQIVEIIKGTHDMQNPTKGGKPDHIRTDLLKLSRKEMNDRIVRQTKLDDFKVKRLELLWDMGYALADGKPKQREAKAYQYLLKDYASASGNKHYKPMAKKVAKGYYSTVNEVKDALTAEVEAKTDRLPSPRGDIQKIWDVVWKKSATLDKQPYLGDKKPTQDPGSPRAK